MSSCGTSPRSVTYAAPTFLLGLCLLTVFLVYHQNVLRWLGSNPPTLDGSLEEGTQRGEGEEFLLLELKVPVTAQEA
jgi:hypothetical protein